MMKTNKLKNKNKKKQGYKSAGASIPVGGVGSRRRGVVGLVRSLREQARRKPPLPPQGLLLNPLSPLPPSTNNSTHAQGWIQMETGWISNKKGWGGKGHGVMDMNG